MKEEIFDFLTNFNELREKNMNLLKNNINILDELHANENAHTRILLRLFELENDKKYPVLDSFIENCIELKLSHMKRPKIFEQYEYMDGFIIDPGNYILIIENKINWAVDQKKQIETYVEKAKEYANNYNIDHDKVYLIYLTDDGEKKPKSFSFTDKAKNFLEWKSDKETGRFIELNYRYDILPMLESLRELIFFKKDPLRKSYLLQYIDYLQGRYNIRKNETEYYEKMRANLMSKLKQLGISGKMSPKERCEKINELQADISQCLEYVKEKIYPNDPKIIVPNLYTDIKKSKKIKEECFTHCSEIHKYISVDCCGVYTYDFDLKTQTGKYLGIEIVVNDDSAYNIYVFSILKNNRNWLSEDKFDKFLEEQPGLKKYLVNNKKYRKDSACYCFDDKFKDYAALFEKLKKEFVAIQRNLVYK